MTAGSPDCPTRIGVFGGSFDPVHEGHLAAAEEAAETLALARVILVPAKASPHKLASTLAGAADRLAMTRLAVEGRPRLDVSDAEILRPAPSYTADTVRELREKLGASEVPGAAPGAASGAASGAAIELRLLIGTDALRELHTWRDVRGLFERATPAVIERPGDEPVDWDAVGRLLAGAGVRGVARSLRESVVRLTRGIDVSSTEIRRRLAAGGSVEGLLPPAVERYVRDHALYGASDP